MGTTNSSGRAYFAERTILVAAAAFLMALATWMGNKTQDLSERVPVMEEKLNMLRRDVDRLYERKDR